MKRRSFLRGLLFAPAVAPFVAKAISATAAEPARSVIGADFGRVMAGSIRSADGKSVFDFDGHTMVIRGDMFADGSITAKMIDAPTLHANSDDLDGTTV